MTTELSNIIQLTDNNIDDTTPLISADNIVWSANDGNDSEIYFYNGTNVTQITDNQLFDTSPQISGGNLVWLRTQSDPTLDPFGSSEIIFYNGTETSLANVDGLSVPAIEGNNVVWGENLIFGGRILLFNGTETVQLTDSGVFIPVGDRSISGENIAWTSGINLETGTNNVFLYDGTSATQISQEGLINLLPVVSGNNVAWSAANVATEQDSEVYFFNGTNTIQLTDNDTFDVALAIEGNNVLWGTGDPNSETQPELFLYNGSETIRLTDGNPATSVLGLDIEDGNIVWAESDGNDLELFFYDGSTTTQITNNEVDDSSPNLEGNRVVWERNDGNDTEIFLANLNSTDGLPDSVGDVPNSEANTTVYRFFNNNSGVHFYTASEVERDAVQELPNFNFEGGSYLSVDPLSGQPEPVPVYRFLNQATGVHLYTVSEVERDAVEDLSNFSFEGEAFFAYESEIEGSIPIYRFFNSTTGAHFYTPSAAERDSVEANLPDFASEGIAYYAFPLEE